MRLFSGLLLSLLLAQAGYGSMLYVDAEGGTGGNTVNAATGSATGWYIEGTAVDQLWGRRAYGNNASGVLGTSLPADIFEATTTSGVENCMPIRTTISGLNPGQLYQVHVVYWSQNTIQNWSIRAGFGLDSMLFFDRTGSVGAIAGTPTGRVQGDRSELTGRVGQTAADSLGQIHVFIDDKPSTTDYTERTWYDGLLYEALNVAQNPNPADGAVNVPTKTTMLSFDSLADPLNPQQEHAGLVEHRVYFDDDSNLNDASDLIAILPRGTNQAAIPEPLELSRTYYWRVDEVLDNGTVAAGYVWSFKTADTLCLNPPAYDFSGPDGEPDCRVDLFDFAEMANAWMECNLIPQSACVQ
jgi:hypothetical protein